MDLGLRGREGGWERERVWNLLGRGIGKPVEVLRLPADGTSTGSRSRRQGDDPYVHRLPAGSDHI